MTCRLARVVAPLLCALAPLLSGCDDSNEQDAKADPSSKMRQTVGARLVAPGETTPGIEMLVSLPANYDAKTALEAVSPAVHKALTDCSPGGTIEVDPGGASMMAVEVEGTKVLSASAAKGSGLDCAAGKLAKAKLSKPMPKKVRLMLLLRPFRPDADTAKPRSSASAAPDGSAAAAPAASATAAPK